MNKKMLKLKLEDNFNIVDESKFPEGTEEVFIEIVNACRIIFLLKPCKTPVNYTFSANSYSNINVLTTNDNTSIEREFNVLENTKLNISFADFAATKRHVKFTFNLVGKGANVHLDQSVFVTNGNEKIFDNNFIHEGENTYSSIVGYGVIFDASRLTFTGISEIKENTPDCEAHQQNKIIIFDKDAVGKANPKLLIHNNKVIASHAASVGKISDDLLFYLSSRGISELTAKKLITKGYLLPIIKKYVRKEDQEMLLNEIEGVM